MASAKAVIDLSIEDRTQFFTLHNAYKSADEHNERVRASWKFLCFVNKHLGSDVLTFFVDSMFDGDDAKKIIVRMIKMRALIQPNL
jgi:hypothetical protein